MLRLHACAGLLLVCLAGLSGCAGPNPLVGADGAAGFWPGLWHGLICPIAFVISLFNHGVTMYEVNNIGGWYNFGFILGAGAWGVMRAPTGRKLTQYEDVALLNEVERRGLALSPGIIDDLEPEGDDEDEGDEAEIEEGDEDEEEDGDDGDEDDDEDDDDEDDDEDEDEDEDEDKKAK